MFYCPLESDIVYLNPHSDEESQERTLPSSGEQNEELLNNLWISKSALNWQRRVESTDKIGFSFCSLSFQTKGLLERSALFCVFRKWTCWDKYEIWGSVGARARFVSSAMNTLEEKEIE